MTMTSRITTSPLLAAWRGFGAGAISAHVVLADVIWGVDIVPWSRIGGNAALAVFVLPLVAAILVTIWVRGAAGIRQSLFAAGMGLVFAVLAFGAGRRGSSCCRRR